MNVSNQGVPPVWRGPWGIQGISAGRDRVAKFKCKSEKAFLIRNNDPLDRQTCSSNCIYTLFLFLIVEIKYICNFFDTIYWPESA